MLTKFTTLTKKFYWIGPSLKTSNVKTASEVEKEMVLKTPNREIVWIKGFAMIAIFWPSGYNWFDREQTESFIFTILH